MVETSSLKGNMERQNVISPSYMTDAEIGGGGSYLCGLFPLGAEDCDMPVYRISSSSP